MAVPILQMRPWGCSCLACTANAVGARPAQGLTSETPPFPDQTRPAHQWALEAQGLQEVGVFTQHPASRRLQLRNPAERKAWGGSREPATG